MITVSAELKALAAKLDPKIVAEQIISVQPMDRALPHLNTLINQPFIFKVPQNESNN